MNRGRVNYPRGRQPGGSIGRYGGPWAWLGQGSIDASENDARRTDRTSVTRAASTPALCAAYRMRVGHEKPWCRWSGSAPICCIAMPRRDLDWRAALNASARTQEKPVRSRALQTQPSAHAACKSASGPSCSSLPLQAASLGGGRPFVCNPNHIFGDFRQAMPSWGAPDPMIESTAASRFTPEAPDGH